MEFFKYHVTVLVSVVNILCLDKAYLDSLIFPSLEGLAVTDCGEGTRSVDAVPLDTPATPLSSGTATTTRTPLIPVWGSSSPSTKTFVLRSVLKKPCQSFSENGKVRVTLPKAKEFRIICFRVVTEIHVSCWCAGKPSLVFLFVKSHYYSEIGSVFK